MSFSPLTRAVLVAAVGLVLLGAGVTFWWWTEAARKPAAVSGSVTTSGTALIGGPFELVDQTGATRTPADFRGRFMLIYFGYTFCPDICPTSLAAMSQGLELLEERSSATAEQIVPIFITVDPERDTVPVMKSYAEHFHPRMVALTGSAEQAAQAAKAYRVFYGKVEDETAGDYLMDHSSFIYLMGPDGSYVTHLPHDATPEAIADALQQHAEA